LNAEFKWRCEDTFLFFVFFVLFAVPAVVVVLAVERV